MSTKFQLFKNFRGLNFCGFYFRVSVAGRENRENLDLTKISFYTVFLYGIFVLCVNLQRIHKFVVPIFSLTAVHAV